MNERFITHFENNEATRSQSVLLELTTFIAPGDLARIKVLQAKIFNSIRPFVEGIGKLLGKAVKNE